MPFSFSVCLFQCWWPLFLLLWFWRLLSGSTAKHPSPRCEPEKNSKLPHHIHMPFSWVFLDYCLLTISLWSITPVGRAHLLWIILISWIYKVVSLSLCMQMEMWPCRPVTYVESTVCRLAVRQAQLSEALRCQDIFVNLLS